MSNGIGSIMINGKSYEGIKLGAKYVKRLVEVIEPLSVLIINCTSENNLLKISNQPEKQIEYIKIFNVNNLNENLVTEISPAGTNEWTLNEGTYKVYINGEFNCIGSICEFTKIELANNLTSGYKMFYECDVNTANSDYEIRIPDSMVNTESMFENTNLTSTVSLKFNTIENCANMYKGCSNLKRIGQEYINVFDNESVKAPNLTNHEDCFFGCENICCGNNEVTEDKPRLFKWIHIPDTWGVPAYTTFTASAGNLNISNVETYEKIQKIYINGVEQELPTGEKAKEPTTYVLENDSEIKIKGNFSLYHSDSNISNFNFAKTLNAADLMFFEYFGSSLTFDENTDTSRIKSMQFMFTYNKNLTTLDVSMFNVSNVEYMNNMFWACTNATSINVSGWDVSNVKIMYKLFYECYKLTSLDIANWNTSKVTNMTYAFSFCQALQTLAVDDWDVSNVTTLEYMFYGCSNLISLNISKWKVGNVTSFLGMFGRCFNLVTLDPSRWDVSNCTIFEYMFQSCLKLTSLDLSEWNTKNAISTYAMFHACTALQSLDVSNWNTENITNAQYMFYQCSALNSLDISNWNTKNITNMYRMFSNCSSLTSPVYITLDSSKSYNFELFMDGCASRLLYIKGDTSIDQINSLVSSLPTLSNEDGVINIRSLSTELINSIIIDGSVVTNADTKGWKIEWADEQYNYLEVTVNSDNGMTVTLVENIVQTEEVVPMSLLSEEEDSIMQIDESTSEVIYETDWGDGTIDSLMEHTYATEGVYMIKTKLQPNNLETYNENYTITNCFYIRNDINTLSFFFENCYGLTSLNLSNCDVSNVLKMDGMFGYCTNLTSVNVSNWDTSKVDYLNSMFYNDESLTDIIGIGEWNTCSVQKANYMFYCCTGLTDLNLSGWDTSQLETIANMFDGCSNLTNLNLSNWSLSNLVEAHSAFDGCKNISEINIKNWGSTKLGTGINRIFCDCANLKTLDLSSLDTSNICEFSLMLYGCSSLTNYIIPITFSNNFNYYYFDQFLNNSSIKYLYIKGTPDASDLNYLITELPILSNNDGIIDMCSLSTEIIKPIIEDNTVIANASDKGWTIEWTDKEYNYFEVQVDANNEPGMTLTLVQHINNDGSTEALELTDWGDGNINSEMQHTYEANGTYIIKTKLQPQSSTDQEYLGLVEFNYNITKCYNIRNNIDNLNSFFFKCIELKSIDLSNLDVDNIGGMFSTFFYCSSLTSLDVSNLNTSNVTSLYGTFAGCYLLTSLDVSNWNTSNVTDMEGAFCECGVTSLDLSNWNASNITSMSWAFSSCYNLTTLNLSNWNTNNIDITAAFDYSENLSNIYMNNCDKDFINNIIDVIIARSEDSYGTMYINILDGVNVETAKNKYWNIIDTNYNYFEVTINDTNNATLNLVQYIDNSNNTEALCETDWGDGTIDSTNTSHTYTTTGTYIIKTKLQPNNSSTSNTNTLITNCYNININRDTLNSFFRNCTSLTSLDLSNYDSSEIINLSYMFSGCISLTSLDLSNWDTSNVKNIDYLFHNCSSLESVNLENWNIEEVESIDSIFDGCTSLKNIENAPDGLLDN